MPLASVYANDWLAIPVLLAVVVGGVYLVSVLDELFGEVVSGSRPNLGRSLRLPVRQAALLLCQSATRTEHPDRILWPVAPAAYAALAAAGMAVIPFAEGFAVADVRTGIVVFGAAEVLTFVAVYLHGWSANAPLALIGGYRSLVQGFSFMLLSMFVLIGVALPARSLSVGQIVEAQSGLWNVVRHPLGLPLFLVVGLGAALWGPLRLPDSRELAGGTVGEVSGPQRLAWEFARRAMLVSYAVMAASAFLGGYLGPWLPGPVWLLGKSVAMLAVFVALGHLVGRARPERFMAQAWTVLLPLSFLDILIAGVEALP